MSLSYVVRMPDLSKLDIPEKQRNIPVRDEQIFQELRTQNRRLEDREDGAVKGDYVLVDIINPRGATRTVHIELGGKAFSEYGEALLGCQTGQEKHFAVNGEDMLMRVRSVRKVVDLPLTDEAIVALQLPGVSTLADYRRAYLREHGEEMADRVFRAIQQKLMNNVLALADIHVDEDELDLFNRRQTAMLQNISGDVNERLMKAYGGDGTKTMKECYKLFYADNRRNFTMQLWGKALAEQEGVKPSEEEYQQALAFYCLAFDTTEEQVKQEGLQEEALRSFYMQLGIGRLRDYYKSLVNFTANEIPAFPLKG